MKRTILYFFFITCSISAMSQNEEKSVTLDEVTVNGAKVFSKTDGQVIYPTEAQKKSSNNGYSILQKLSLANLRVDNVAHTVTAVDNKGGVQIRINGIIVGKEELLVLDTKTISKIDFIDNPGVRYGDDVAYVINIATQRQKTGYTLGADMGTALTNLDVDCTAYGNWNTGKSQFSVAFSGNGSKHNGTQEIENAEYRLNDSSLYNIERNDIKTQKKAEARAIKLTYNLADSTDMVFQASVNKSIQKVPEDYSLKNIVEDKGQYEAVRDNSSNDNSQWIDLYFFRQLTSNQSITANSVGTYISSGNSTYYNEWQPYQYDVVGKTASALSEVVYENRLKPFALSAGIDHRYKYTKNEYVGDASAITEMKQNAFYLFSEIKGTIRDFRYSLGLGASYQHYIQGRHSYNFWTFRPKVTVAYNIVQGLQASYTFEMKDRSSRIAMVSDVVIQRNSMEDVVGNPDLKPSRDRNHTLKLSYNNARLQTYLQCFYRHCDKPNMAHYERTADDRFVYTQINQKEISLLHSMAYVSYWLLPEKLSVSAYGGMQRCFNYGYDYTHCYTSWFFSGDVCAYLGSFTLRAYTDNGSRFLEGETKGYNGAYTALQASYSHKDWQFSLTWGNPFVGTHRAFESELLNCNIHKVNTTYNKDSGNWVNINVAWRMNRGKKHTSANKTINLSDTDNGIIGR